MTNPPTNSINKPIALSDAWLIGLVCFFATLPFFSIDLVTPAMPNIMVDFQTSPSHIQSIVLIYILGLSLSQFICGPLSDTLGRRYTVIMGTCICLLANCAAIFSHSIISLSTVRFFAAFGSGTGMVIARVVFRDVFSGKKLLKANAFFAMSINLSPAIAPFAGGLIQELFGWRSIFTALTVWTLVVLWLIAWQLPETLPKQKRSPMHWQYIFTTYADTITHRPFIYSTLLSGACLAGCITYLLMSPFLYQLFLGLTPSENGLVYFANAAGFLLGAIFVNRFTHRYNAYQFILQGLIICIVSSSILLLSGVFGVLTPWVLLLPAGFNSVGAGLIMPSTGTIALSSIDGNTGVAAALFGGIRLIIVAICSVLVIMLPEQNQIPMGSLMTGFAILGMLFYWRLRRWKA